MCSRRLAQVWLALLAVAGIAVSGTLPGAEDPPSSQHAGEKAGGELGRKLLVRAVDSENRPVPGVTVQFTVLYTDKAGKIKLRQDKLTADDKGMVTLPLDGNDLSLSLWAWKSSYATVYAEWDQKEIEQIAVSSPAEFTLHMLPVVSAGGRIVDEDGRPVAGVKVEVVLSDSKPDFEVDPRLLYSAYLAYGKGAVTTDAEGRWQISCMPKFSRSDLRLALSHPDFILLNAQHRVDQRVTLPRHKALRGEALVIMKPGNVVTGRVTDDEGKPINNAWIIVGDDPPGINRPSRFPTDADGRFRLHALPTAHTMLTVVAPGFAPQKHQVKVSPELKPLHFRLHKGEPLRVTVVNENNEPIPNASVQIQEWKYQWSIFRDQHQEHPPVPNFGIPRRANAEGVWEWKSAPKEPVPVLVSAEGYSPAAREVGGGNRETTIKLYRPHRLTVTVVDSFTGKPVPHFRALLMNVLRGDDLVPQRSTLVEGKDGHVEMTVSLETDDPFRLRIEAAGYRTQDSRAFRRGDRLPSTIEFHMQPSPPVTGVVQDAMGKPLAKVRVALATPSYKVGVYDEPHTADDLSVLTDEAGRFAFPDPGTAWAVVVSLPEGFASVQKTAGEHDAGVLRLQPWATIRGQYFDGGKPVANAVIDVWPVETSDRQRPRVDKRLTARTDEEGRFELARVAPGAMQVFVILNPWSDPEYRSGPSLPLEVKPGQTVELKLGQGGAIVSGRVKLMGEGPSDLDCSYSVNYLICRKPGINPPPELQTWGLDLSRGWQDVWLTNHAYAELINLFPHWFVKLSPDGAYRISGVPPGEYDLSFAIYAKPEGCLVDPMGRRAIRVTVTEEHVRRGILELPDLEINIDAGPAIGSAPRLKFIRRDGSSGSLEEFRGRFLLIHFWASWCVPCKKDMPTLRQLEKQFGDKLQFLGVAVQDQEQAWRKALDSLNLNWPQVQVDAAVPGVSRVPTYWLLDPEGKLLIKASELDAVRNMLVNKLP